MASEIMALQPSLGNAQAMAQVLATRALVPVAGVSINDSVAAAVVIKAALTDPQVYFQIEQSLGAHDDPLAREILSKLSALQQSLPENVRMRAVFDREMAPVEQKLSEPSLRSTDDVKTVVDSMFAGAQVRAPLSETDGVLAQTTAPGEKDGKIHLSLTKPTATTPASGAAAVVDFVVRETQATERQRERTRRQQEDERRRQETEQRNRQRDEAISQHVDLQF